MNSVNLHGRLTADPDVKLCANGTMRTKFSLAINSFGKDKEQLTEFIPCVAFNKLAEVLGDNLLKGSEITIRGRLHRGSYEVNGERRYSTDVIIKEFKFCGSKKKAA